MPTIRIHDVRRDYPKLERVEGIDGYSFRSLLLPGGSVVIPKGWDPYLQLLLSDYRRVGVGPESVIEVPVNGSGIYGGLLSHRKVFDDQIRPRLDRGARLDFFCSSIAAKDFAIQMGLDWSRHTSSPDRDHAEQWNDKGRIRQTANNAGMTGLFPSNQIVSGERSLRRAVRKYSKNGAHGVVMKVTNQASSEGMTFIPKHGDPSDFIKKYFRPRDQVIVEEAWEHHPFSVVFDITDMGATFVHASLQYMDGVNLGEVIRLSDLQRGIPHRGNVVGSHGQDLGPLTWTMIADTACRLQPIMMEVMNSGYRGKICADLLLTECGLVFLLEFNARTSNSMYVNGVNSSVERTWGHPCVSVGANIHIAPNLHSYADARARLGSLLHDGTPGKPGVLLYHTPLISLDLGKAGLIATASTYAEAVDTFHRVEEILS